jgi:hypothetical protein
MRRSPGWRPGKRLTGGRGLSERFVYWRGNFGPANTMSNLVFRRLRFGDTTVTRLGCLVTRSCNPLILLAGGPGFEPGLTESESAFHTYQQPSRDIAR